MEHRLQIYPRFFNAIDSNKKTFELRRFKGFFIEENDIITLLEFDGLVFTGRKINVRVTYVFHGMGNYALRDGFFAFSFEKIM